MRCARSIARARRGSSRTQLRIVYDAIRRTAGDPVGTVVPADFLFEELSANLLQSGVLLREIHEAIVGQDDRTPGGALKSRLCALVFLIRKLPREAGVDSGVRATADTLADLLVQDLAGDGAALRGRLPALLDELAAAGTLMKLDDEYSLQTRESSGVGGRVPQPAEPSRQRPDGHERQARPTPRRRGAGGGGADTAPARGVQGTAKALAQLRRRAAAGRRPRRGGVDTRRLGRRREERDRRRARGRAGQPDDPRIRAEVPRGCARPPHRRPERRPRHPGVQGRAFHL